MDDTEFLNQRYFRADHYKWVIICNEKYDVRRKDPGWEGLKDIKEVKDDYQNVRKGIKELGARDCDIIPMPDCTYEQLHALFKDMQEEIRKNSRHGEKTLVFIYYAGHGVNDEFTFAVVNDEGKKKKFPLEAFIRTLGTEKNGYVVGVLDCCREKLA